MSRRVGSHVCAAPGCRHFALIGYPLCHSCARKAERRATVNRKERKRLRPLLAPQEQSEAERAAYEELLRPPPVIVNGERIA